jgi:hypothetical protein
MRDAGFAAWPLGLESLRIAGGDPREVLRDGPTEVLLDGRRASEYALIAAASTSTRNDSVARRCVASPPHRQAAGSPSPPRDFVALGGPNPTGCLRRRVLLFQHRVSRRSRRVSSSFTNRLARGYDELNLRRVAKLKGLRGGEGDVRQRELGDCLIGFREDRALPVPRHARHRGRVACSMLCRRLGGRSCAGPSIGAPRFELGTSSPRGRLCQDHSCRSVRLACRTACRAPRP